MFSDNGRSMRQRSRCFLILSVLAFGTLKFPASVAAQLSPEVLALPLAGAIAKFGNDLQTAIEQAREAGRAVSIEAGIQANYALQNFAAVYEEQRGRTVRDLNAAARQQLGEIAKMTADVSAGAFASADQATLRAQQIVNSLPFRRREPQLTRALPRFVAPSPQEIAVSIEFTGNFEQAADPNFRPRLTLDGRDVPLVGNTTQSLTFQPSSSSLNRARIGQPSPSKFAISVGELRVPWRESGFLSSRRREHVYRVMIGMLPETPGQITVRRTITTTGTQESDVSMSAGQRSDKHGGNDDHKNVPYELKPSPGCSIVRGTSRFVVASAGGDWSKDLRSENEAGVVYIVNTIYHRFGAAGRVDFSIHATQRCPTTSTQHDVIVWNKDGASDLRWGEQRSLPLTNVTNYSVELLGFDGLRYQASSPGMLGSFVQVNAGGGLELRAVNPRTLQWP